MEGKYGERKRERERETEVGVIESVGEVRKKGRSVD